MVFLKTPHGVHRLSGPMSDVCLPPMLQTFLRNELAAKRTARPSDLSPRHLTHREALDQGAASDLTRTQNNKGTEQKFNRNGWLA
ncbi:MAG: hypothetical protein Hens2KO_02990 [Henriciella sp.]